MICVLNALTRDLNLTDRDGDNATQERDCEGRCSSSTESPEMSTSTVVTVSVLFLFFFLSSPPPRPPDKTQSCAAMPWVQRKAMERATPSYRLSSARRALSAAAERTGDVAGLSFLSAPRWWIGAGGAVVATSMSLRPNRLEKVGSTYPRWWPPRRKRR